MPFRCDRSTRTCLTASDRHACSSLVGALALSVAALLWLAPAALAQINFTGPTNFASSDSGADGPSSVAVGDFNADSDPDLVVTNFNGISRLVGGADGSFTAPDDIPFNRDAHDVAVADFNGDSDPDLAVTHFDGVRVLLGVPGASFTFTSADNYSIGNNTVSSVAVGDFNGDSDPDLVVARPNTDNVAVLLGGVGASFTGPTSFAAGDGPSSGPQSVAVGDFNGDSDPDLAVANNFSNDVSVLLGGAGGGFSGPTSLPVGSRPTWLAVGDFNGDSDPDLAVANSGSDDVSVLVGGADASFIAAPGFDGAGAIAVGDFNGDSDPDLAVTNGFLDRLSVRLGGAGASFTGPTYFATADGPLSLDVGDFDADSDLDLAVANGTSHEVSVLLNTPLPVNNPPTAGADAYTTAQDTPLDVAAPGVLGNDSDPEGDTLTATVDTGPAHGTLALNADGSFTYTPAAGYSGQDSFTYKAGDGAGSSEPATVTITVTPAPVVFSFTGFFSPVDNLPTLNSSKAGSAVPVKFSLAGDQGLNIFAATYPKSEKIACDSNAPVDGIEETATPSDNNTLQYNPLIDQYTYVWKTEKSWAKTCRQLVVKLSDETVHQANFQFR
jgi:VCBS repeat-containing protein